MTQGTYFAWELASRGDAPCVRDDRLQLSYVQFAQRVDAVAQQLAGLGVGPGDMVATFLPNRAELLITLMAAWRLRAVATPVNPGFTDAEAEYQLGDSGAKVVVGQAPVGDPARIFLDVDDLAVRPTAQWTPPTPPTEADDALLIYTSGSTGRPKGVRLGHDNLHFFGRSGGEHFQCGPDTHALLILPLFHVNAICVSCLTPIMAGGQVSITGQFSVSRFFDDVTRLRPTFFSAVPTIYALLVSQAGGVPPGALDSLRYAICGAAPISPELLAKTEETFGVPIVEGYGLTEATCASACNPVGGVRKLGTVGPALPGQRIRIVDANGDDAPTGQRGEVLIAGPAVMRGYLNRPEATAETIVDGWLHTGDVGILDDDGYLRIVDRIKDMIIRGGENIYPKEIEAALATNPAVLECAVVGAPDPLLGEVPVAFVVGYPGTDLTADDLAEFVAPQLTKVKRPSAIHIVDALPRNPVGKIDKPGLRRQTAAAGQVQPAGAAPA
ncbi:AMP-binding protein [Gordonia pseudamarae]|uniref:AMP-binding protein n=1 Tax=Gordonia pseudamarae TaxID=2831662 RepID=A0ABX6IGB5_9ACTN|nr:MULTISPECIES: AMP-binding protein [Gordonia]MBD0024121.1 AMP-binding protein [Gordonia sp. (in: high G+C Gram-positive bacteria)]QHN25956.1 AMP-binding protein [Gordonia pseudamarae]QHN34887.1 AMP-binding protein [Gordonia pseudamarae]